METLSNILASFDIFQVILTAFPQIFLPVVHAFEGMFMMFSEMAGKQFASHPGLISGTIIFLLAYAAWTGLSRVIRTKVSARPVSPGRSL